MRLITTIRPRNLPTTESISARFFYAAALAAVGLVVICCGPEPIAKGWSHLYASRSVDRSCAADPGGRYIACQRNLYDDNLSPDKPPDSTDIVLIDREQESGYHQVAESQAGSLPSVTSDGSVMFRVGDRLKLVDLKGRVRATLDLGAEFSPFILPVISPDARRLVLWGRRLPPADSQSQPTRPNSQEGVFLIDIASRRITALGRDSCPSGRVTSLSWQDASTVLLGTREEGHRTPPWDRAAALDVDKGTCMLAYFGDAFGRLWTIHRSAGIVAAIGVPRNVESDASTDEDTPEARNARKSGATASPSVAEQLMLYSFDGEQLATVPLDGHAGTPVCLSDMLGLPGNGDYVLLSCLNARSKGYNPTTFQWKNRHAALPDNPSE